MSFGPDSKSTQSGQDGGDDAFTPKKSQLSRLAQENNVKSKSLRPSLSSEHLPFRTGAADDQPTYNASYLNELRNSTPSRPKDVNRRDVDQSASDSPSDSQALDIAAKFGVGAPLRSSHPSIPTGAEIREKKERRARLAQEQRADDFIGLSDASEDDEVEEDAHGNLVLRQKKKSREQESRLQRDDEDIAEGFDELVEDGRVPVGRRAERELARRRKQEMVDRIREAEGGTLRGDGAEGEEDDERDEEEAARHAAYEAAQTAAGAYGVPGTSRRRKPERAAARERARGPDKTTPMFTVGDMLAKMREQLKEKEYAKMMKQGESDELEREKGEVAVDEVRFQKALKEAGNGYDGFRAGLGIQGQPNGSAGREVVRTERGLESFGSTPMDVDDDSSDE